MENRVSRLFEALVQAKIDAKKERLGDGCPYQMFYSEIPDSVVLAECGNCEPCREAFFKEYERDIRSKLSDKYDIDGDKVPFIVSLAVDGRVDIEVNAHSPLQAKNAAMEAFSEANVGDVECLGVIAVSATNLANGQTTAL